MQRITIGDRAVGPGEPTYVIAEAGSNHNGDLTTAKALIDVAVDAGADAVKFQTFRAAEMYVEDSGIDEHLDPQQSMYEIINSMEMPYEWIPELHNYCRDRDIHFMSTPFDEQSARELQDYVPAWKVASFTASHHPFLRHLATDNKPIIMSTGAHELEEIIESIELIRDGSPQPVALLHCVASYPTPLDEINVSVIETLSQEFDVPVGLSDHTLNPIIAPGAAVALGASIIEKHFTLDRTLNGPDHKFALEPNELDSMIDHIRRTEEALGSPIKRILGIEGRLFDIARRHIHAIADINAGQKLDQSNVAILRSGKRSKGLNPRFLDRIIGIEATRDIQRGDGITWDDINLIEPNRGGIRDKS